MIPPSTYYILVHHQAIKLLDMVTFGLIVIASLVLLLAQIRILLQHYVNDVILIGDGVFVAYLRQELVKNNVSCYVVQPLHRSRLGYQVETTRQWTRETSPSLIFPSPTNGELVRMADQYNLSLSQIEAAWLELRDQSIRFPSHSTLDLFRERVDGQSRQMYRFPLTVPSIPTHRGYVKSISFLSGRSQVQVDNHLIEGNYCCLVNVTQEDLLCQYIDLEHPRKARLAQTYSCPGGDSIGTWIERDESSFQLTRDSNEGKIVISSDVDLNFSVDRGYYLPKPARTKISEWKIDLPPSPEKIEHLFFDRRLKVDLNPLILDTLTLISSSPERDLLILIHVIAKMLGYK